MAHSPDPSDLPVEAAMADLRGALAAAGHAVLQAPPGAGKTTLVPLRLLHEPWLAGQRIVILEPRRLATRAAASRMASLIGEPVGVTVGYATRDERRIGPATLIEVVTEGILTRRLQHDPSLPGVGLVVFDEIHERNLQTDLALALALDVRSSLRPDLHLLAMSATLDTAGIATVLGGRGAPAPVVVSHGRQYPVAVRWSPPPQRLASRHHGGPASTGGAGDRSVVSAVVAALGESHNGGDHDSDGDILVFLAGAADIRRVQSQLARVVPVGVDVLPLFGALSTVEQDLALAASRPGRRRVVVATDIAETSLTVEGVRVVIDSGWVRSPRYDASTGLTRLRTVPASRSSADQRAGRAGRQAPGVAYRLWSEQEHTRRRPFPLSEMATVDLAGFVLELAVWGAEPGDLAFLEAPPQAALDEGRAVLVTLGALDATSGRPTDAGRAMADLPLHPRLARMVIGALPLGLGVVACALAALLEDRDILPGRPDDVGVDVAERVQLITDGHLGHRRVDRSALSSARRRAVRLARRAGVSPGPIDVGDCGRVLALAYPDRLAQARGRGRFRLRTGTGAWMAESDPLATEAFLVVAQLDADAGDSRIRLAAGLDASDLESAAGAQIQSSTAVVWDAARDDLRATVTRSLDGLVLGTADRKAPPGPATVEALLQQVRNTCLGALSWTNRARAFQQRVLFLRRTFGDPWPDLSDAALLATIDDWLAPLLATAVDRAGLAAVNLTTALRALLPHPLPIEVDRLAPLTVTMAGARKSLCVDYSTDLPTASVRIQDLFGSTGHPMIAGGQTPLVLHLLSPAGRPIQVTADLPGFWTGSYASVRKDMAGRYPKHRWPVDPGAANEPR